MVMSNKRVRVIIDGIVQGVFFRAETTATARNIGVNGWVKNRADGTVEAVFEGAEGDVEKAIEWCRHGPAAARVESVDVKDEEYTGEYEDFRTIY